jgi:hypothetical protein
VPDLTTEPLPEVEYTPRGAWTTILAAFLGFWLLFGINAFLIGVFTETSVSVLAALAAIGEIILGVTISVEDAVVRRNGIYRERSPEEERYIRETMKKTGCDRGAAVNVLIASRDITDL